MSEPTEPADVDAAHDTIHSGVRATLTGASVIAERLARTRAERLRERTAADGTEAEQLHARWLGERAAASAQLTASDDAWLDRANLDQAAEAWQTAQAWATVDPTFEADAKRLADRINSQYGIDPSTIRTGQDQEAHLRAEAEHHRDLERETDHDADLDEAAAVLIGAGAGRDAAEDRAVREHDEAHSYTALVDHHEATADSIGYDTDARRAALADRVAAGGANHETIHARVQASKANAIPVRAAGQTVKTAPTTRTQTRRQRARTQNRATGLER